MVVAYRDGTWRKLWLLLLWMMIAWMRVLLVLVLVLVLRMLRVLLLRMLLLVLRWGEMSSARVDVLHRRWHRHRHRLVLVLLLLMMLMRMLMWMLMWMLMYRLDGECAGIVSVGPVLLRRRRKMRLLELLVEVCRSGRRNMDRARHAGMKSARGSGRHWHRLPTNRVSGHRGRWDHRRLWGGFWRRGILARTGSSCQFRLPCMTDTHGHERERDVMGRGRDESRRFLWEKKEGQIKRI